MLRPERIIQIAQRVDLRKLTYHQSSQFETATDPKVLKHLLSWFDQFREAPMPHKVWLQCQLALIEGFTNAIRHAHAGLPSETPIRIEIRVSEKDIDIRIWDQGPGFDLDAILEQKLGVAEKDAEGGRGLRIIYLVADNMSYQPVENQGNCLHIHKTYRGN